MKKTLKNFLENNRWIKWIPNGLTLCNSLCGFAAIIVTLQAYKNFGNNKAMALVFGWSAGLILFAMVFDAFDGFAARLLNAASMHGIQMDSLADMTTFGVAPATLVSVMAHNMRHLETPREYIPICILCGVYLGCVALRLATYNVHAIQEHKSDDTFSGLPSPGGASAICVLVIYTAFKGGNLATIIRYLPLYAAVLGLLMVSRIPYMHFAKWLISVKRNRKRLAMLLLLLAGWLISGIAMRDPVIWPLLVVNAYVIWGPIAYFSVKLGFVKVQNPLIREYSGISEDEEKK